MVISKAILVNKDLGDIGTIASHVPIGFVYEVQPESIRDAEVEVDGKITTFQLILTKQDDGSWGWFPLSALRLEDN